MARRGGGNYSVTFYREECATHLADLSGCDDSCELTEKEYEVSGGVSAFVPAKTYGRPEDCYPAEGGEVEDITVTLEGKDVDLDDFSPKDQEKMAEMLSEAAADDDGDYDDRDDYDDGPADSFDPPDCDSF